MEFYRVFKVLLLSLIIANIVDGITTIIGLSLFPHLAEGGVLFGILGANLSLFLTLKLVVLSLLLAGALLYILHVHDAFPKLWENEAGLVVGALVMVFYLIVISNNVFLIVSSM